MTLYMSWPEQKIENMTGKLGRQYSITIPQARMAELGTTTLKKQLIDIKIYYKDKNSCH